MKKSAQKGKDSKECQLAAIDNLIAECEVSFSSESYCFLPVKSYVASSLNDGVLKPQPFYAVGAVIAP